MIDHKRLSIKQQVNLLCFIVTETIDGREDWVNALLLSKLDFLRGYFNVSLDFDIFDPLDESLDESELNVELIRYSLITLNKEEMTRLVEKIYPLLESEFDFHFKTCLWQSFSRHDEIREKIWLLLHENN